MIAALALLLAAQEAAPVPLLRDPIHDGAADASTVYDPATAQWRMFYTNRRANLALADPDDVSWVHGTHIGTATSRDGMRWTYDGPAALPVECTGPTLWAPEVQRFGEDEMKRDPHWGRRSVLQIAELHEAGGVLSVDREAAVRLPPR
ncbi:hypothetical protein [Sphingomonas sp. 37zxx]|uniref:hypothetical protein n=1 Tax=Sphingomonas sp. 37zxx TaxID=1550073 RepID=UPI0012E06B96|nr:hypothetical protein [Sphingomonas sp. 37zxx]